jgi:hypothetical protein
MFYRLLTACLLGALSSCSSPSVPGKQLKSAALNCDLLAFRQYMPAAEAERVANYEAKMQDVRDEVAGLLAIAQRRFGPKVERTERGLRFQIDAADPRWVGVFGPEWQSVQSSPAPHYFSVNAAWAWSEECKVVRRFEACLEDASFCEAKDEPGSVIQMRRSRDGWQLRLIESEDHAAQSERMVTFLRQTIQRSREQLASAPQDSSDEDVLTSLASSHMRHLREFMAQQ